MSKAERKLMNPIPGNLGTNLPTHLREQVEKEADTRWPEIPFEGCGNEMGWAKESDLLERNRQSFIVGSEYIYSLLPKGMRWVMVESIDDLPPEDAYKQWIVRYSDSDGDNVEWMTRFQLSGLITHSQCLLIEYLENGEESPFLRSSIAEEKLAVAVLAIHEALTYDLNPVEHHILSEALKKLKI